MTTKEYTKKYNLSASAKFDHSEFIEDLTMDFATLLEVGKSPTSGLNMKGFENTVRAIRQKWDAISNKTVEGGLPNKLWGYFYATRIAKMREGLFPKEMEQRRQAAEARREQHEEYRRFLHEEDARFDNFFFSFMLSSLFAKRSRPDESFKTLGLLPESATAEEVRITYRKLAFGAHPDTGGSREKFIEITEAKNKCLAYLSK